LMFCQFFLSRDTKKQDKTTGNDITTTSFAPLASRSDSRRPTIQNRCVDQTRVSESLGEGRPSAGAVGASPFGDAFGDAFGDFGFVSLR